MPLKFNYYGTTDDFYIELQKFVGEIQEEGCSFAVTDRFRSMGGGAGYFSVTRNSCMFFSVRTWESNWEDIVSCTLDVEDHSRENSIEKIFERMAEFI